LVSATSTVTNNSGALQTVTVTYTPISGQLPPCDLPGWSEAPVTLDSPASASVTTQLTPPCVGTYSFEVDATSDSGLAAPPTVLTFTVG
jgi:hypothetical protein